MKNRLLITDYDIDCGRATWHECSGVSTAGS